jgi:hypothetical protein
MIGKELRKEKIFDFFCFVVHRIKIGIPIYEGFR